MNDFTTEIAYFRSIKTEYGELTLEIPRDRNGEFKQQTLPAYKRTNDTLETTIIQVIRETVLTFDQSKPNMVN
ncbi:hypothetical protein EfmJHP38_30870 (plasmid) [Enterococcus faecium]|nr:hypothetical protein EfmJHP38_30870 [Enterococcus faecium]